MIATDLEIPHSIVQPRLVYSRLRIKVNYTTSLKGRNEMPRKANSKKKYSSKSQQKVHRAMHEMKEGKLKSGRSGKKVNSRKQAIAIGLSEARKAGAKVPAKKRAKAKTKKSSGRS
jgi:hypothetical protein